MLAHRLQIKLVELGLLTHLFGTDIAGKVVDTPRFVQRTEHVSCDHQVTCEADVAEQLMVVSLAVGQPLLLIMSSAEERLLTLRAHKVLHVPRLPQRVHNALTVNRTSACSTYGDAHLVVTTQTVQLTAQLTCVRRQLDLAVFAVEVIGVVGLSLVFDVSLLDDTLALMADVLALAGRVLTVVAFLAQRPVSIFEVA